MNDPSDSTSWHHAPPHRFLPDQTYMVTGSTWQKARLFHGPARLALLCSVLLTRAHDLGWILHAWAVLENHYHFIGTSPGRASALKELVSSVHTLTASGINRLDQTPGRQVWFQFWDTCLTYPASYYARLNYVMNNPVKHGVVKNAGDYPYGSAGWFEAGATAAYARRVRSYRGDRLNLLDDF